MVYAAYEYVIIDGQRPIFWLALHRPKIIILKTWQQNWKMLFPSSMPTKSYVFVEEDLNNNVNIKAHLRHIKLC